MNNITHYGSGSGLANRFTSPPSYQADAFVRQQAMSTRESLDTDLVIRTKEGDQITLAASSFSQMDAFLYDSSATLRTEEGTVYLAESQREITLASGQSFTFSVSGDLNEAEIEDIENLLKGLDEVIAGMKSGDLQGALNSAMHLGGYDTFDSFAADINYQWRSMVTSETTAVTQQSLPADNRYPRQNNETDGEMLTGWPQQGNRTGVLAPRMDLDTLFENMLSRRNENAEHPAQMNAPMQKLLRHHLHNFDTPRDSLTDTLYTSLENLLDTLTSLHAADLAEQAGAAA